MIRLLRWAGLAIALVVGIGLALTPFTIDDDLMVTTGNILNITAPWYIVPGLVVMAKRPWHQVAGFSSFSASAWPRPAFQCRRRGSIPFGTRG